MVRYSLLHLSISIRIRKVRKCARILVLVKVDGGDKRLRRRRIMIILIIILTVLALLAKIGLAVIVAIANASECMEEFYD